MVLAEAYSVPHYFDHVTAKKMHYKKTVYAVSSSYDSNNDTKDSMKLNVQQRYYSLLIICFTCFWYTLQ